MWSRIVWLCTIAIGLTLLIAWVCSVASAHGRFVVRISPDATEPADSEQAVWLSSRGLKPSYEHHVISVFTVADFGYSEQAYIDGWDMTCGWSGGDSAVYPVASRFFAGWPFRCLYGERLQRRWFQRRTASGALVDRFVWDHSFACAVEDVVEVHTPSHNSEQLRAAVEAEFGVTLGSVGYTIDGRLRTYVLPFKPILLPLIGNTILYAIALQVCATAYQSARGVIRRHRGQCARCAYPRGLAQSCSECGART